MGGGGGATSSAVAHVTAVHKELLVGDHLWDPTAALPGTTGLANGSLLDIVDSMLSVSPDGNPFSVWPGYTEPYITNMNTDRGDWRTKLDAINPDVNIDAWVDSAVATLDTAGVLGAIASQFATSNTEAGTVLTSALAAGAPDNWDPETLDWITLVGSVVTQADLAGNLTTLNFGDIVLDALAHAGNLVDDAITKAASSINAAAVTASINAFTASQELERARAVRNFSGTMADVNAVQGSAFVIGLALVERGHTQDTARFAAELRQSIYMGVLTSYLNTASNTIGQGVDVERINKIAREEFIVKGIQTVGDMHQVQQQFLQAVTAIYTDTFRQALTTLYQARIVEKEARDRGVQAVVNTLLNWHTTMIGQEESFWRSSYDLRRVQSVLEAEHETAEVDLLEREYLWDIQTMERASNIVSSLSGMAHAQPAGRSRLSSALGGALGGASAGSTIPGVGTLVGGIMGGLAGLLG